MLWTWIFIVKLFLNARPQPVFVFGIHAMSGGWNRRNETPRNLYDDGFSPALKVHSRRSVHMSSPSRTCCVVCRNDKWMVNLESVEKGAACLCLNCSLSVRSFTAGIWKKSQSMPLIGLWGLHDECTKKVHAPKHQNMGTCIYVWRLKFRRGW